MFKSLIHFQFIFVYGVRKRSSFILLQVVDQFSQHRLLKRLSLYSCLLCRRQDLKNYVSSLTLTSTHWGKYYYYSLFQSQGLRPGEVVCPGYAGRTRSWWSGPRACAQDCAACQHGTHWEPINTKGVGLHQTQWLIKSNEIQQYVSLGTCNRAEIRRGCNTSWSLKKQTTQTAIP